MPQFDIIETSGKAYITAWEERSYLLKLALFPILAKILFFAVVIVMDFQANILRQTLIMLPAYFFEGWMMAHVARFIFLGERGASHLSGDVEKDMYYLAGRGRAIFAAILIFVLIRMGQNAFMAPFAENQEILEQASEQSEPPFWMFALASMIVFFLIWGFKYLFIYLPVAVGLSIHDYIEKLPGVTSSLYLIGAWLTCYVPFLLCGMFIMKVFAPAFGDSGSFLLLFIFLVHSVVDLIALTVVTICFSMFLMKIFSPPKA